MVPEGPIHFHGSDIVNGSGQASGAAGIQYVGARVVGETSINHDVSSPIPIILAAVQSQLLQNSASGPLSRNVHRLVLAIHEKLFDVNLSVKTVKKHCQLYDNNISCYFRREMGMTIKSYIESSRMRAAAYLLICSTISVSEIACLVGYWHLETFHRVFVRHFGCTPGVYRRGQRSQKISA